MSYRLPLPLLLDAAWRLGPRPVFWAAWHRAPLGQALLRRALANPSAATPTAPWPSTAPPEPPPNLPTAHTAAILSRAAQLHATLASPPNWHGAYPASQPAASLNLFHAGDIRPIWERNRWAELPLLAQAQRLAPVANHAAQAQALLADWCHQNPAFRGPNWACGQEAALRTLHLCLALALLGAAPNPGAQALLTLHAQRIAAAPGYAAAQDNNHPISEAAGLLAIGLALGQPPLIRRGTARLNRHILRLVSPCGAFAQASTGYHRLLLDVVALTQWLAQHHAHPGLSPAARTRMAAATTLLWRLTCPSTGATPRLGHQDGSAFADLALAGPNDARPSLERAARLFLGHGAGLGPEPGCAWLTLPTPHPGKGFTSSPHWQAAGLQGWATPSARAFLRTGPLRFRPAHADLLHLDLWDHAGNLLRDGGTGAYNPPPAQGWWLHALAGSTGHNSITFNDAEQMPRLSRFLFARWPAAGPLPQGGWVRDHHGNHHSRTVTPNDNTWLIEDHIAGPFRHLALRWRLAAEDWRLTPTGITSPRASLSLTANAPLTLSLEQGWESPAYGQVKPAPVLVARARAPVSRLATLVNLTTPAG